MTLDENAAAFGLFHLTFANLTQQLVVAVLCVRQLNEPDLTFDEVFSKQFSCLREMLKDDLKQLVDKDSPPWLVEDVRVLRNLCSKMGALADWRNQRIHALVRIDENGIGIFDRRTRKPLSIDRDECIRKIREAIKLNVALEMHARSLVGNLSSKKRMVAILKEAFRKAEESVV